VKYHWELSEREMEKFCYWQCCVFFVLLSGIIGAAALDFFNIEISMEIVNQTEEEERTGKKEHVVFLVTQNPLLSYKERNKFSFSPQCLDDSEKQIDTRSNNKVF